MKLSAITAEKQPTKVGAAYESERQARNAARELLNEPGLDPESIAIVKPHDPALETKLEPEGHRIWQTLIRAHITMGLTGAVIGFLVASLLAIANFQAVVSNPWYAFGVMSGLGFLLGLMVGGLLTLRPDHDVMIHQAKVASEHGEWFVLVHARSYRQKQIAQAYFQEHGKTAVSTL